MGWEATLPYLSPELTGQKLLVGANFASAGVGVLNDTGIQFVSLKRKKFNSQFYSKQREFSHLSQTVDVIFVIPKIFEKLIKSIFPKKKLEKITTFSRLLRVVRNLFSILIQQKILRVDIVQ